MDGHVLFLALVVSAFGTFAIALFGVHIYVNLPDRG